MKPWIIGHRGAAAYCRENTLESFAKAIELGADGIEFDVRRTRDGVLIIHHDAEIDGISLATISYPEARNLALHRGYSLCRLDEVIDATAGRLLLDVELKEEGYEEKVVDQLRVSLSPDHFFLTSFSLESMRAVQRYHSELRTGWLTNSISDRILNTLLDSGMDLLLPGARAITPRWADRMRQSGIKLITWTVNHPDRIHKLLSYPCIEGLISDRPDLGLRIRDRIDPIRWMGNPGNEHGVWRS